MPTSWMDLRGRNTGQPSDPRNNNPAYRAREAARKATVNDPFRYVSEAQQYAEQGVQAYGDLIRPELMGQIGDTLGGLNSIGALRSGGTQVALNDLTQTYADRIGTFAQGASLNAIGAGLQAYGAPEQRKAVTEQTKSTKLARRGDVLRGLGQVLGTGIGYWASGGFGGGGG